MSRVDVLVFSRNRAAQLDLLLRSIDRHARRLYRSVTVLWTASDDDFLRGYKRDMAGTSARMLWMSEDAYPVDGFQGAVLDWLRNYAGGLVSFLVDDDVFYRPAPTNVTGQWPFALRLGRNTVYCHPQQRLQQPPSLWAPVAPRLAVHWRLADGDFGYPISLDGTIFTRETIAGLIESRPFFDPPSLEAVLAAAAHKWFKPRLLYFADQSCLVGVPHNRVSRHTRNPTMSVEGAAELNRLWLDGERISLDSIEYQADRVNGAHAELAYMWEDAR